MTSADEAVGSTDEADEAVDPEQGSDAEAQPLDLEGRWEQAGESEAWVPPTQRRRRQGVRLAGLVVVAALIAAVVYGAIRIHHEDQLADARSSALSAGKQYAELISTYTYSDFASYSKQIVAHSTKAFSDNYTKDAGSLGSILAQYKAGSKGTAIGAGLGPGTTTTKATVYVFLNETVSNSKDPSQSERARMVVSLVRPGGRWLIANAIVE